MIYLLAKKFKLKLYFSALSYYLYVETHIE